MKKTALFILAAGALVLTTLPVDAQQTATQQVQKDKQKTQAAQAVTKPATTNPATTQTPAITPAGATNPAPAAAVAPPAPPVPLTCTWDVTDYDFGKSPVQLKPASATFNLTNAGKEPITITQVQTSCGCTSPKYTKEPIKPGEKGEVVLTYDAKVSGYFSKSATVKLNDGQKYALTIKGEVQKVEATPATTPPATPPVIK
jgi:hypothetical protein